MIELSFAKLALLALVALIVLGPEKLPGAARTTGVLLRRLRSGWDEVRAEVTRELAVDELRRDAQAAASGIASAQAEFRDAVRQMHQPIIDAAAALKPTPTAAGTDLAPPATKEPAHAPE